MQPKVATTPRIWSASKPRSTRSSVCGGVFSFEIIDERVGTLVIKVAGPKVEEVFQNEAGGHRWQRTPPNEKRGRVHTSTVTVAVLPEPSPVELTIRSQDIEWQACRGSGAGGQHRNVTDSAVQVRHVPTGLMVRCESERSQHQNRSSALELLRARLWQAESNKRVGWVADSRKAQVGSGMRGDKRRTIRVQDGQVHDHVTGQRWQLKAYLRGEW